MLVVVVHGAEGAGASTVAANLAIALTQYGTRVVLLDLDIETPTQHRLFGIPSPVPGLRALLSGDVETAGEVLTNTELKNLFLVASTQAAQVPPEWTIEGQRRLLAQLAELDTDILLIDGGRDLPAGLRLFEDPSVCHVLVSRPEIATLGSLHRFVAERVCSALTGIEGPTDLPLWSRFEAHAHATTCDGPDLDTLLAPASPELRARIEGRLAGLSFGLIGNGAAHGREDASPGVEPTSDADFDAGFAHATSRLLTHRLGVRMPVLGVLTQSPRLAHRGHEGPPFLMSARHDRNSQAVHVMAEILLSEAQTRLTFPLPERPLPPSRVLWPSEGEPVQSSSAGWKTLLDAFTRRSQRFEVDWYGTLRWRTQGRSSAARVFEVSEIGASVETAAPMREGDSCELRLDQVSGAPTLRVKVQRLHPGPNRAGLSFEGASPELRQALMAIARAHQP